MRTLLRTAPFLALVAALLAMGAPSTVAGGGGCHASGVSDAATTEVRLTQNCFEPAVTRVEAGETVTWVSNDAVEHTVTGARTSFGGYDEMYEGDTYTTTFETEGVFPYFCFLHPGMIGTIVVGDGVAGGEAPDDDATATLPSGDDGDNGLLTVSAVAAIALTGAALGMAGTRLVGRRFS